MLTQKQTLQLLKELRDAIKQIGKILDNIESKCEKEIENSFDKAA